VYFLLSALDAIWRHPPSLPALLHATAGKKKNRPSWRFCIFFLTKTHHQRGRLLKKKNENELLWDVLFILFILYQICKKMQVEFFEDEKKKWEMGNALPASRENAKAKPGIYRKHCFMAQLLLGYIGMCHTEYTPNNN